MPATIPQPNGSRGHIPIFSDRVTMQMPLFSMRKRPSLRPHVYSGSGASFRVKPCETGVPTIWDRDIIIYITSHLLAGRSTSRVLSVRAHNLLRVTRRSTGVKGYEGLMNALYRLRHAQIETSIGQQDAGSSARVSWLDDYIVNYRTCSTGTPQMSGITVTLSQWAYDLLLSGDPSPVSADYFSLTGGLERRLYELTIAHCDEGSTWTVPLRTLATDAGSDQCNLRRFKFDVKAISTRNSLPGISIHLLEERSGCLVQFSRVSHSETCKSPMKV